MYAEITETDDKKFKNLTIDVEYVVNEGQVEIVDLDVSVFDEYSQDWISVTEYYGTNLAHMDRLTDDVLELLQRKLYEKAN